MKTIPNRFRRKAASLTLLVGFCILHRIIFFRLSVESYVQPPTVSLYWSSLSAPTAATSFRGIKKSPQTRIDDARIRGRSTQSILRDGESRREIVVPSSLFDRSSSFALNAAARHLGPGETSSPDDTSCVELPLNCSSPLPSSSPKIIRSTRHIKSTSTITTKYQPPRPFSSRRAALATMTTTSAAAALLASSPAARASVAEINNGLLYTPKKEMLAGGSAAARGIRIEQSTDNSARVALKQGQLIQNVYDTRFIAYLSRFLINFDDAANAYWNAQIEGIQDGQDQRAEVDLKFAEFSESVEIGLADYFVGPYGSYSSLSAMKAGISAKYQARSKRYVESSDKNTETGIGQRILRKLAGGIKSGQKSSAEDAATRKKEQKARNRFAKQGILNLYTLLKARYKTKTAKVQLAILFSFISNPAIQPTREVRSLLAEADDASVTDIELRKVFVRDEVTSRTSCKRGGGYSVTKPPLITMAVPPALGSAYKVAKAKPTMRCTSRVLRINVIDGGAGYTKCPDVYVSAPGSVGLPSGQCVAQSILGRKGQIESIFVLDPGYGYGRSRSKTPPKVVIKGPESTGIIKNNKEKRQATAVAELEYEIASIEVVESGNGYVSTEPPRVYITPPDIEPDWYVDVAELAVLAEPASNRQAFGASVVEMRGPKGTLTYRPDEVRPPVKEFSLRGVRDDPIELLPTILRPTLNGEGGKYFVPSVAAVRTNENARKDNPRFRAVDPLFGAIGALPVQKSALGLKPNEYGRLALSGAVCTVLVRTALNPLELIKTKLQLENDEELLSYARKKLGPPDNPHGGGGGGSDKVTTHTVDQLSKSTVPSKTSLALNSTFITRKEEAHEESGLAVATKATPPVATGAVAAEEEIPTAAQPKLSSQDLITSLIDLRGFPAIFQSADITLLASIMFGSLGFGATELFRRSFTEIFFEGGDGGGYEQLVLLLAATVATVVTCAAAAPFELLRVRSMGLVEPQAWTTVMKDFLEEKSSSSGEMTANGAANGIERDDKEQELESKINLKDYVPLWAGFGPTTSRELAFAIPKFLAFDIIAKAITGLINSQMGQGALPIQVGVGGAGLAISAFSGAFAGIAGAFVSHPADLILTRLSASSKSPSGDEVTAAEEPDWKDIVKELLAKEGGVANLYVGLTPRLVFFFLVIGLQFFLYDYVKNILEVGSDDLSLVLDVFYAVRQGLIEQAR